MWYQNVETRKELLEALVAGSNIWEPFPEVPQQQLPQPLPRVNHLQAAISKVRELGCPLEYALHRYKAAVEKWTPIREAHLEHEIRAWLDIIELLRPIVPADVVTTAKENLDRWKASKSLNQTRKSRITAVYNLL